MAIFDIDTKFIFSCALDMQRIKDDRHHSVILEGRLIFFFFDKL